MKDQQIEKSSNSENIRNIEEKIPPLVFSEFLHYSGSKDPMPEKVPVLKKELVRLAQEKSIDSFRKIESMINEGNLSGEMKDFAMAALNYCRFTIENDIFDMPVDMISGGLGGTTKKIRYYLALSGKDGISQGQSEYLEMAFKTAAAKRDSVLEEIKLHDMYVSLLILGSFDYAIGDIVDEGIRECDFLERDYYLTNIEIPTDDRIRDWLDGKLDDSEFSVKT